MGFPICPNISSSCRYPFKGSELAHIRAGCRLCQQFTLSRSHCEVLFKVKEERPTEGARRAQSLLDNGIWSFKHRLLIWKRDKPTQSPSTPYPNLHALSHKHTFLTNRASTLRPLHLEQPMSRVSRQEVDRNGRMKIHRSGSDAERSMGFEDAALPRSRGDQERDKRDRYPMTQSQAAYAQEPVSQVHDPEEHGFYVDGRRRERSSSPIRRQGRTDRLCDYQGMIRAEYALLEVALGGRGRQHIPVEESEVDGEEGEGEGAGCLEVLKPGIKRLFGCLNRNKTHNTHTQGSSAQKLERTGKHRPAPRAMDNGMPSPRSPDQQGYIPFQEDWRWPEGSGSHPVPNGVPNAHVLAQGVGPGGQASSPVSLQPANVTITPSMFSAAETVNISGGHFYTAETVIVQHIYQSHPPNSPTTRVL